MSDRPYTGWLDPHDSRTWGGSPARAVPDPDVADGPESTDSVPSPRIHCAASCRQSVDRLGNDGAG